MKHKGHEFKNCSADGDYLRFRKQVKGEKYDEILGRLDDDLTVLIAEYLRMLKIIKGGHEKNTLRWLADLFFKSSKFRGVSDDTQDGHRRGSKILDHELTDRSGNKELLGDIKLRFISKPLINQSIEKRLDKLIAKGLKGTGVVNLEISFLKTVLDWGCGHVSGLEITNSPLIGLKYKKVQGRTRYVEDAEYHLQRNMAPPILQCLFEVAYLCACRSSEVLALRESDIVDGKLYLNRRKGSKSNYVRMSERLKSAIDKAISLRPKTQVAMLREDKLIFTNNSGSKLSKSTLADRMQRLKQKLIKAGHGDIYWTMHLLKHKGMTDAKDKDVAGLSEGNKKIYDHSIPTNEPVR